MKYGSTNNDLQIDKAVWILFQYILLGQIKPVRAPLAEILKKSDFWGQKIDRWLLGTGYRDGWWSRMKTL